MKLEYVGSSYVPSMSSDHMNRGVYIDRDTNKYYSGSRCPPYKYVLVDLSKNVVNIDKHKCKVYISPKECLLVGDKIQIRIKNPRMMMWIRNPLYENEMSIVAQNLVPITKIDAVTKKIDDSDSVFSPHEPKNLDGRLSERFDEVDNVNESNVLYDCDCIIDEISIS